jgi:NTE family protein
MMTRRALVLGGGGTIGVAWLTGLAAGLAETGLNLADADLFVGTSAGSVVSTQLAFAMDPQMMLALQLHTEGPAPDSSQFDAAAGQAVFARWATATEMTPELTRYLCDIALEAKTMPEEAWLSVFAVLPEELGWPAKDLRITAVNAHTGEFQVWTKESGVPLYKAVASSCTVPGLLPPVTLNGSRYVDGGVRSGTNADLAAGYDKVLIVAPLGHEPGSLGALNLQREIASLREGGAEVKLYHPDRESLEAFGPDLMSTARRAEAAQAGVRQGKAIAVELAGFWA